ncbi:uncharacterized protein LOC143957059 [Lithobates pipiens]
MEKERSHMTERILNLTLEIVYLLTGENYIAFKLSDGLVASNMMKIQRPVIDPPSHCLRKNKKVKEVTSEIIELLTGEEVNFSFCTSDIMIENRQPLTSPDGSSNRNPPERCPRPLYSRDSTQEHQEIPHHYQIVSDMNQNDFREEAEESYMRDDELHKKEIPPEISTDSGDTRETQENLKAEEEEEEVEHVRIKVEDIPPEISTDNTMGIKWRHFPLALME